MSEPVVEPATWENRNFARPEGLHYLRHAQALARWPILDEEWARRIEAKRLALLQRGDIRYFHGAGR